MNYAGLLEKLQASVAKSNMIGPSRWERLGSMVYGYDRHDNLMLCLNIEEFNELMGEGSDGRSTESRKAEMPEDRQSSTSYKQPSPET